MKTEQLEEASGPILGCIGLIVLAVLVLAATGWCVQGVLGWCGVQLTLWKCMIIVLVVRFLCVGIGK